MFFSKKNTKQIKVPRRIRFIKQMMHYRFLQRFKEKISFIYLIKRHIKRRKNATKIAMSEIIMLAGKNAFPLLICIFSFPTAIPIPYPPGFVSAMGLVATILSFQMAMGRKHPKLPKIITNFSIKKSILLTIIDKFQGLIFFFRKFFGERLTFFTTNSVCLQVLGAWFLFLSFLLFLPIPLTNVPLGMSLALGCFAIIMKDGLLLAFSIIIGSVGVAMCVGAIGLVKFSILKILAFFG